MANALGDYTTTYEVPSQYVGKTLAQIRDEGNSFRPDVLGSMLGVGENEPLRAGQYYQVSNLDPNYRSNSSEAVALRKLFTPGPSPEVRAVQPAVNALSASKQPLIDRYSNLIDMIKGNQKVAENRQTLSTANELARRGISGGGYYDQQFADTVNPITQQYTGQIKDTGFQREIDLNKIDQAIATIQSNAGLQSISDAFQQQQFDEKQKEFNAQNDLAKQQLQFQMKYITIPGLGVYDTQNKNLVGGYSSFGATPSGYSIVGFNM